MPKTKSLDGIPLKNIRFSSIQDSDSDDLVDHAADISDDNDDMEKVQKSMLTDEQTREKRTKRNITVLANARTLLGYLRSCLGILTLGVASFKVFDDEKSLLLLFSISFCALAAVVMIFGGVDWRLHNRHINKGLTWGDSSVGAMHNWELNVELSISTHDLAIQRTHMANTRTILAYIRTSLPFAALAMGFLLRPYESTERFVLYACAALVVLFPLYGLWSYCSFRRRIGAAPPSLELAALRTALANTRNLLSYNRTLVGFVALSWLAVSVSDAHIESWIFAGTFIALSLAVCLYGIYAWWRQERELATKPAQHDLALIRTRLANTRTYLANLRTAQPVISFIVTSCAAFRTEDDSALNVAGWVATAGFVVVSLIIMAEGASSWYGTDTYVLSDPSTHHLAIRRTFLANHRTAYAFVRVGLMCLAVVYAIAYMGLSGSTVENWLLGIFGAGILIQGWNMRNRTYQRQSRFLALQERMRS